MEAVSIVTIKNTLPLFKNGEHAERIELIQLEEVGFELVSQKELYQIGDKAVYIQPDYNLSDIELFDSFLRPNGDASKSMLGKVNGIPLRIRAKKFNFHKGDGEPIYSNGILLPYDVIFNYLTEQGCQPIYKDISHLNLTEQLGITKWEEPELVDKKGNKISIGRSFPEGLYKTDETNINNLWGHIEKHMGYPITLIGTEKVDGSSISIGVKNGKGFICSRNMELPFTVKKHVGRRNKSWYEKLLFWTKPDLNLYKEVENESDFIKYGKKYLEKLIELGFDDIVLRGELNGSHLKGSGNKNNPSSKLSPNIKFFGSDTINEQGISIKNNYRTFVDDTYFASLPTVGLLFHRSFESREQIEKICNDYFKNDMIEGIVVRSPDSKFSAKFMNNEYDSKK